MINRLAIGCFKGIYSKAHYFCSFFIANRVQNYSEKDLTRAQWSGGIS